jgi:hypothetical protein
MHLTHKFACSLGAGSGVALPSLCRWVAAFSHEVSPASNWLCPSFHLSLVDARYEFWYCPCASNPRGITWWFRAKEWWRNTCKITSLNLMQFFPLPNSSKVGGPLAPSTLPGYSICQWDMGFLPRPSCPSPWGPTTSNHLTLNTDHSNRVAKSTMSSRHSPPLHGSISMPPPLQGAEDDPPCKVR